MYKEGLEGVKKTEDLELEIERLKCIRDLEGHAGHGSASAVPV
jgi:hypothetical protein